jgi:hypothetical protein
MSPPSAAALAAPKLGRFKAPVILSHPQICGRSAVELRASSPAAGNGIFGCGNRAPKIVTKLRQRSQRPKSGKSVAESPRNALFGITSETRGLQGLDGGDGRDQTANPPRSHSNQSLAPESGTEIFDAETGAQNRPLRLLETDPETLSSVSRIPGVNCGRPSAVVLELARYRI